MAAAYPVAGGPITAHILRLLRCHGRPVHGYVTAEVRSGAWRGGPCRTTAPGDGGCAGPGPAGGGKRGSANSRLSVTIAFVGAAVHILCAGRTGVDQSWPIAQYRELGVAIPSWAFPGRAMCCTG
ncbi:hypothetical protein GCM10009738_80610 [Kitasatospora viridis]